MSTAVNVPMNGNDDKILALARTILAATRESGLESDDYQAAFTVARELLHAEWGRKWHNEARTLGELVHVQAKEQTQ